jgi:hypothetical protein
LVDVLTVDRCRWRGQKSHITCDPFTLDPAGSFPKAFTPRAMQIHRLLAKSLVITESLMEKKTFACTISGVGIDFQPKLC